MSLRAPPAIHGKGFVKNTRGGFRQPKFLEFAFAGKRQVGNVAPGPRHPANLLTKVVGNYKMETRPAVSSAGLRRILRINTLKDFDEVEYLHDQTRFFQQLARNPFHKRLAEFERSTRNRPLSE